MCLWLFIAESTFYRYYIKRCHLTCFHWGSIVNCVYVWKRVFIFSFLIVFLHLLSYFSQQPTMDYKA